MEHTSDSSTESSPLLHVDSRSKSSLSKCLSARAVFSIWGFLGFVNVYALRMNLSVALVAMVNSTKINNDNVTVIAECQSDDQQEANSQGEFTWDENTQGLVLGAFFYGYILTQLPGGWLAERYGGKWLFGVGILTTSLLTLLTPVAARTSVYLFIALRIVEGFGEGVTFPAMHAMIANWAPQYERSKITAIIHSGAQFGTVLSLPVSGLLCEHGFAGGWPSVFYVFGTLGCLWFIFWALLIFESPHVHPRISTQEREFIEKSTKHGRRLSKPSVPWTSLVKSTPLWGIMIAHFCNNWGLYTLLTCMPIYLSTILRFDISSNGLISALPYLALSLMIIPVGIVTDRLRYTHILSTTTVRKFNTAIGLLVPAILLIVLGFVGCNRVLAVALLTGSVAMISFEYSGYNVNHLDIAPPFAGTLFGITNTAGTIPGILAPQVVGALTYNNQTVQAWQIIFGIAAVLNACGSVAYVCMAQGEEQKWSKSTYSVLISEKRVTPD